jgi:hypothetical protein
MGQNDRSGSDNIMTVMLSFLGAAMSASPGPEEVAGSLLRAGLADQNDEWQRSAVTGPEGAARARSAIWAPGSRAGVELGSGRRRGR